MMRTKRTFGIVGNHGFSFFFENKMRFVVSV